MREMALFAFGSMRPKRQRKHYFEVFWRFRKQAEFLYNASQLNSHKDIVVMSTIPKRGLALNDYLKPAWMK